MKGKKERNVDLREEWIFNKKICNVNDNEEHCKEDQRVKEDEEGEQEQKEEDKDDYSYLDKIKASTPRIEVTSL